MPCIVPVFVLQLATVVPEAVVLLSCGLVSFHVQKGKGKLRFRFFLVFFAYV